MSILDTIRSSWKARRDRELKRREDQEKAKQAEIEEVRGILLKHTDSVSREFEALGFKVFPSPSRSQTRDRQFACFYVVSPVHLPYRVEVNRNGVFEIYSLK